MRARAGGTDARALIAASARVREAVPLLIEAAEPGQRVALVGGVVRDLLLTHYDPGYAQSMLRNFTHYPQAGTLRATDRTVRTLDSLARQLIEETS